MQHMKPNIAIVLAGGSGKRLGADRPKQFLRVRGKTILEHTVDAFEQNENIAEIAIVSNPNFIREVEQIVEQSSWKKVKHVLAGGKERYDSSMAALKAYEGQDVNLLLHDGVRPLVSQAVINRVCDALQQHEAIGVALPAVDTIVEADRDRIVATPDRSRLRRMQTPQAFSYQLIAEAYRRALADPQFKATDDCGVVIKYMPEIEVHLVEGEESNLKLTYKEDLPILERHFSNREAALHQHDHKTAAEKKETYLQGYAQRNLREMQLKMLDILVEVRDILDRNKIDYWLDGSTLLGAVRHGGFIPWNDQVNICIHEGDMDRWAAVAQKELPDHLFLQTPETDTEIPLPVCRVRDITTLLVEEDDDFARHYAKGLYVNIRPMHTWPSFSDGFAQKVASGYCKAYSDIHLHHAASVGLLLGHQLKRAYYSLLWNVGGYFKPKNKYYGYRLTDSLNGRRHLISSIFPLAHIEFEGEKFKSPANEDLYLKDCFGDYMQLPPESERKSKVVSYTTNLK